MFRADDLQIKQNGWAFGQIADMEEWWASIEQTVGSAPLTVTGYSLGGHLATAFTLLHGDKVAATYTFNGAGVGDVNAGERPILST